MCFLRARFAILYIGFLLMISTSKEANLALQKVQYLRNRDRYGPNFFLLRSGEFFLWDEIFVIKHVVIVLYPSAIPTKSKPRACTNTQTTTHRPIVKDFFETFTIILKCMSALWWMTSCYMYYVLIHRY